MIEKITHIIEKFNYNVIAVNLYEIYNFYNKQTNFYIDKNTIKTILIFYLFSSNSTFCTRGLE